MNRANCRARLHPGSTSGFYIWPPLASFNLSLSFDWIYPTMPPLFFYNLYEQKRAKIIASRLLFKMAARQTAPGLPALQTLVQNIVSDIVGENSSSSTGGNENLQSSSAGGHDNVTQELHARFGVPRQIYNPCQNYGRATTAPRRRSRQTYLTNQSRSNERTPPPTVSKSDFYLKNVFLLPSPSWDKLPRGDSKESLNSRGLVIDGFEITRLRELFKETLQKWNQSFVK